MGNQTSEQIYQAKRQEKQKRSSIVNQIRYQNIKKQNAVKPKQENLREQNGQQNKRKINQMVSQQIPTNNHVERNPQISMNIQSNRNNVKTECKINQTELGQTSQEKTFLNPNQAPRVYFNPTQIKSYATSQLKPKKQYIQKESSNEKSNSSQERQNQSASQNESEEQEIMEAQIDQEEQNQMQAQNFKPSARIISKEQNKLKYEYQARSPRELGIYQWNPEQDQLNLNQIPQQQQFLAEFQKQIRLNNKIESPALLQKFDKKIYLKSIECLVSAFDFKMFPSYQHFQQLSQFIQVKIVKNNQSKEDNHNKMVEESTQNSFQKQSKSQLLYKFEFQIQQINICSGSYIENSRASSSYSYRKQNQFFQSLEFLLQNKIVELECIKFLQSPYKNSEVGQIYLNTRSCSSQQKIKEISLKKQAICLILVVIRLNLINYYQYACQTRLASQVEDIQNGSSSTLNYTGIFYFIYKHLNRVHLFLNKPKKQNYQIILQRLKKNIQEQVQQKDDQQSDESYNIQPEIRVKPKNNKIANYEVSKQQLEQLFESGNWFSLSSQTVQAKKPSSYFRGELKKYQEYTLAWMLYRENCNIQYKIQRPQQHYQWQSLKHTFDNVYFNIHTKQMMNFIPYWIKHVKGGLLCDQMGLGKTVMSLALIDTHIRKKNRYSQIQAGTLIIVPTSVLSQWQEKILQFLPHMNYIVVAKSSDLTKQEVLKADIVVTTFGIVRNQRINEKNYQFDQKIVNLYRFNWFRVIIDEADNLRNHKTFSARGIKELSANYVWLLTGTPIQNKISDMKSYFSLLNYNQHGLLKDGMKKGFFKSDRYVIRIKESLKDIMVRRKKDSLDENGNKILELKQYKWNTKIIEFTEEQEKIYDMICTRVLGAIDKIIKEEKNYQQWIQKVVQINQERRRKGEEQIQHIFGQLIKLRQFCCHPELLYSKSTFIKYEAFAKHFNYFCQMGYDLNTLRSYNSKQRKQMKNIFRNIFLSQDQIRRENRKERVYQTIMSREPLICTLCQDFIKSGILTICLHLYCQTCFKNQWHQHKKTGTIQQQHKKHRRTYMVCVDPNCEQKIYHRQTLQLPRANRFNKNIKDIQPNNKILQLIKQIEKSNPNEKIVVFTQFIGMIQILKQTLPKHGIWSIQLTGSDSVDTRTQKIRLFKTQEHIKVMVISTKCGYAGLNLQNANKMFFMEPWWNPAVEDQALGRLHRIGQQNFVQATRYIIKNSIQQIISMMGQQKRAMSDFVLDSDSCKKRKQKVQILKVYRKFLASKISMRKLYQKDKVSEKKDSAEQNLKQQKGSGQQKNSHKQKISEKLEEQSFKFDSQ